MFDEITNIQRLLMDVKGFNVPEVASTIYLMKNGLNAGEP